jgi:hypothetical protein
VLAFLYECFGYVLTILDIIEGIEYLGQRGFVAK